MIKIIQINFKKQKPERFLPFQRKRTKLNVII